MNKDIEKLLRDRYFLQTESSWEDVAKRVSGLFPEMYEDIRDMYFMPSSPTLMNANTKGAKKGTLSSCFPMGIEDSIDGIFESLKECAKVTKAGGGVGIDGSTLRGSSEVIKTLDGRTSSGPLPFIAIFNEMLDGVNQAGCLTADSLISTTEGLFYLDELIKDKGFGWHNHEIDVNTEEGIKASKGYYCNGIADTKKITTEHGLTLSGTHVHGVRIFTESGFVWKSLQDVIKGDYVAVKLSNRGGVLQKLKQLDSNRVVYSNETIATFPDHLTEDFAFLLGYMIGNGSFASGEKDYRICFTVPLNSYLLEELPQTIKKLFNVSTYIQKGKGACYNIFISNKSIKEFFQINGLNKSKSLTAAIPFLIRKSPKNIVGKYLCGLFEADGTVIHGYPSLGSSSVTLIKEVSSLLLELGCPHKIFTKKSSLSRFGKKDWYLLRLISFISLESWKKNIGCSLQSRFMKCFNWDGDLGRESNYILPYPRYWLTTLFNKINESFSKSDSQNKLKKEILRYFRGDRNFSISSYKRIKNIDFVKGTLPQVNDIFFSKVISIKDCVEEETFDINVEEVHSYIANGIITHNSRRGAGMFLLSIEHENILDFIYAKKDLHKFNRFNFSIKVTDDFYKKLKETPTAAHIVKEVVSGKEKELKDKEGNVVTVRELWNHILDQSYNCAEPGIFNSDIAFRQCAVTNVSKSVICNPCLTGDTLLLTDKGNVRIDSVVGIPVKIWNGEEFSEVIPKITAENQKIFDFIFSDGTRLSTTPYHKFILVSEDNVDYIKIAEDVLSGYAIGEYCRKYDEATKRHTVVQITGKILRGKVESNVYCFNEPKLHQGVFNGILTGQCAEHIHLPYSSCCLGSINLSKLVEGKKFNWEKFEELIVKSTRFLNNVLDKNHYPIKKIEEMTMKTRPIGLGFMGLAHALYKKEVPYNSDKAIKFTEEMVRYLTLRAMKESVELAKEYQTKIIENNITVKIVNKDDSLVKQGAYEAFDYDLFIKANERFFKYKSCRNIDIEQLQKDIKKYGVRNSALTAGAPTGTISTLSECSSGIEPVFALAYTRRVEVANNEYENIFILDPIFEAYVNTNFNEEIKNRILKEVSDNNGSCQKCKDIPKAIREVFVVAEDLTPTEHLDILEVGCKNISMGISKTINLPEDVDKKTLEKVFLDAHDRGVIGVTIYRSGSRSGILLAGNTEVADAIIERDAPKRPKSLPCHVYKITVKGDQWVVFVGLYKEHPYEVFAGKVDLVDIPSTITDGILIKVKSGTYVFEHNGEILIKDIAKIFESAEQEALTRMISTNLRHGTPVEFIIDQLSKSYGTIVDFNKAILRALKSYMKEKKLNKQCPSCGQILIYKEGCIACIHCGWSKCA